MLYSRKFIPLHPKNKTLTFMEHLEKTEKVHDEQLLHRRVDLLLRTGKLLVESLADTNRVVRNMKRTAAFLGIPEEKLHINVSFTMLMVNVSDGDYSFTKFQRIEGHGVNMTAISDRKSVV